MEQNFDLKFENYHNMSFMCKGIPILINNKQKTPIRNNWAHSTRGICVKNSPVNLQCAKSFLFS